jgi:hypothetical protein
LYGCENKALAEKWIYIVMKTKDEEIGRHRDTGPQRVP